MFIYILPNVSFSYGNCCRTGRKSMCILNVMVMHLSVYDFNAMGDVPHVCISKVHKHK